MKDLWIIGDTFVYKNFHALPALQTQNRLAKKKELYVYEQYNVHCFTANLLSVVRNVATRIVNAFIKALNDYNFLLHFVLVMPNMDITKSIKLEGHAYRVVVERILSWVMTAMEQAVQSKKDMLFSRKPGAVVAKEPKIIWIKAVVKPSRDTNENTVTARFNDI